MLSRRSIDTTACLHAYTGALAWIIVLTWSPLQCDIQENPWFLSKSEGKLAKRREEHPKPWNWDSFLKSGSHHIRTELRNGDEGGVVFYLEIVMYLALTDAGAQRSCEGDGAWNQGSGIVWGRILLSHFFDDGFPGSSAGARCRTGGNGSATDSRAYTASWSTAAGSKSQGTVQVAKDTQAEPNFWDRSFREDVLTPILMKYKVERVEVDRN